MSGKRAVTTLFIVGVILVGSAVFGARPSWPASADGHRIPETEVRNSRDGVMVIVTLTIDEGYHVNANPATFDDLIPTTLAFEGMAPDRISYPMPVAFKPAFADQALTVYEGTSAVVAIFPPGMFDRITIIRGTVTAQACNDQICLPPSDLPVSITLPGFDDAR